MKTTIINAVAPTRICDVGGWTDTRFARTGAVFNIAVYPYVEVQIEVLPPVDGAARIEINAENYRESYALDPAHITYDKHPLLEAAMKMMELPRDTALRVNIFSYAPPGASMGTSAAVSVALIGALDALGKGRMKPHEVAALAHAIEAEELGLECGVQDQLASVHGGINLIDIEPYPRTRVANVVLDDSTWWELEQRLLLVYIGKPHFSSEIHKRVIACLGEAPHRDARLEALRHLAREAMDALVIGDFTALGRIFDTNTELQRQLHKDLVCEAFEQIMDVANDFQACGCKVNGAGGDGGSVAILTGPDWQKKRALCETLGQQGFQVLPIYLSRRGLRVWRR